MVTAIDCQELLERLLPRTDKTDGSSPDECKRPILEDTVPRENDEDIGTHTPDIVA